MRSLNRDRFSSLKCCCLFCLMFAVLSISGWLSIISDGMHLWSIDMGYVALWNTVSRTAICVIRSIMKASSIVSYFSTDMMQNNLIIYHAY